MEAPREWRFEMEVENGREGNPIEGNPIICRTHVSSLTRWNELPTGPVTGTWPGVTTGPGVTTWLGVTAGSGVTTWPGVKKTQSHCWS